MMTWLILSMLLAQGASLQTGVVAGTLRLRDGKPASGMRIAVMAPPGEGRGAPSGAGTLVMQGQTDASGKYQLEDVPSGRYYVVAGRVDNPTFYPGVREFAAAKTVDVRAKITLADVNFEVVSASQVDPPPAPSANDPGAVAVKGRVVLKGDIPAPFPPGLLFDVPAKNGRAAATLSVASNGTFTLPLNPGDQTISLVDLPDGYRLDSITYGTRDIRSRTFRVEPGPELLVTLIAEARPRFRVLARVIDDVNERAVIGEEVDLVLPSGEVRRATVNAQGMVTFSQLFHGSYVLRFVSPKLEVPEKKIVITDSSVQVELRTRTR